MRRTMKHQAMLLVSALLLTLLVSCQRPEPSDAPAKAVLDSLKTRYAPDDRVAVFQVSTVHQGSVSIVKGEVDNQAAKDDALAAVRNTLRGEVLDSIKVLPDPKLGERRFGIVAVSVGNVRTSPRHPGGMGTQALMGMTVKLLKRQGDWYYIQLPDRYLGWLESDALKLTNESGVEAWKSASKVIVTTIFTWVRQQPNGNAQPVRDAVAGVLMRQLGRSGGWVSVELQDGATGFIEAASVEEFSQWKKTRRLTPENIEKTARSLLGIPYLWGGTSVKGMDCSGFTKTVYRLNGLELARDANQQSEGGEEIVPGEDFQNLKKGDLVFFGRKATAEKPEHISHVGIYVQDREFVHTPGGSWVKFNSFDPSAPNYSESLRRSFVRVRRYIGSVKVPEVPAK